MRIRAPFKQCVNPHCDCFKVLVFFWYKTVTLDEQPQLFLFLLLHFLTPFYRREPDHEPDRDHNRDPDRDRDRDSDTDSGNRCDCDSDTDRDPDRDSDTDRDTDRDSDRDLASQLLGLIPPSRGLPTTSATIAATAPATPTTPAHHVP